MIAFLTKFRRKAATIKWTKDEHVTTMPMLLTGRAGELFVNMGPANWDINAVFARLEASLGISMKQAITSSARRCQALARTQGNSMSN